MRIVLMILLCLLLAMSVQTQTAKKETEKQVKKLSLAKEDKDGNIIEDVEVFGTKDIPIYCYINLSSRKPTLVTMNIVAVKAKKIRPNSKIITVRYKTKSGENEVSFNAKPDKIWAEGNYRVDVFLDGKFVKSREFQVQNKVTK